MAAMASAPVTMLNDRSLTSGSCAQPGRQVRAQMGTIGPDPTQPPADRGWSRADGDAHTP
jgi:hypothetical protein